MGLYGKNLQHYLNIEEFEVQFSDSGFVGEQIVFEISSCSRVRVRSFPTSFATLVESSEREVCSALLAECVDSAPSISLFLFSFFSFFFFFFFFFGFFYWT
jgi:hypothetical protein